MSSTPWESLEGHLIGVSKVNKKQRRREERTASYTGIPECIEKCGFADIWHAYHQDVKFGSMCVSSGYI